MSGARDRRCFRTTGESKSQHTPKDGISSGAATNRNTALPQTQRHPSTAQELISLSASAQERDRARLADLEADRSHIQELRTLVVEFKLQGHGGPREAFMANLLVQVREARVMLTACVKKMFVISSVQEQFGALRYFPRHQALLKQAK